MAAKRRTEKRFTLKSYIFDVRIIWVLTPETQAEWLHSLNK